MNKREKNVKMFNDNQLILKENETLSSLVQSSIRGTELFLDKDPRLAFPMITDRGDVKTRFLVTEEDTVSSVIRETKENLSTNYKITCLNFASAKKPGGGVLKGSTAQEEDLCRSTSLYNSISDEKVVDFYKTGLKIQGWYTDNIILSRDVLFLDDYQGNKLSGLYKCDVITCAAPNNDALKVDKFNLNLITAFKQRMRKILRVCLLNQEGVLILGAWGCGVFKNSPKMVAMCFKEVLEEVEFKNKFRKVVFPVFKSEENFRAFKTVFSDQEIFNDTDFYLYHKIKEVDGIDEALSILHEANIKHFKNADHINNFIEFVKGSTYSDSDKINMILKHALNYYKGNLREDNERVILIYENPKTGVITREYSYYKKVDFKSEEGLIEVRPVDHRELLWKNN